MPVFKARKFAKGGGVKNLFGNPGFGLGLQYIPTAQELPDLEGLMYVEQAKNNARTQLETLRKEVTPDVSELTKSIDDMEMFGSIKKSFKRDINKNVAAFKSKMASDPDYAFSMEARNEYSNLMNSLNSSDYQYQALRYKEQKTDYEDSLKKGLGESFYISNGQIPLINLQNGQIEMKNVNDAKELLSSPDNATKYSMFQNANQIWDFYHKYADKNFNSFLPFGGRSTVKDAKTEIDEVFKNVATSINDGLTMDEIANKNGVAVYQTLKQKNSSNADQLNAAVNQLIGSLSQPSVDALRGDYIKRSGDFSDEGFQTYVKSYLSGEASMRHNTGTTFDLNSSVLNKDLQGKVIGIDGQLGQVVESSGSVTLFEDQWLPDFGKAETFDSPVLGKSTVAFNPEDISDRKVIMGKAMVYSNDASSTGAEGEIKSTNQVIYGATTRGFYLMPISTGDVIVYKDGKPVKSTDSELIKGGVMLNSSENKHMHGKNGLTISSTEKKIINIDGQDYLTYPSKKDPNKYIVATPKGFAMYHGYKDKDLDEDEARVVFKALDPTESIQAFANPNFSVDYRMEEYFDPVNNKLSSKGNQVLESVVKATAENIQKLESQLSGATNQRDVEQIKARQKELVENISTLQQKIAAVQNVENGTGVPTSDEEYKQYETDRFQINMLLNEVKRENQISNVAGLTTAFNNSFRANTKFNFSVK